jgi:uncharacterized protein YbbK (DUF523 family)
MILISACLLGIRCRYDGKILNLKGKNQKLIQELLKTEIVIPICPEQLGGLPTPRPPAKIKNGKVINQNGVDVTKYYHQGAQETLKIAKLLNITAVYHKKKSPSCGKSGITTQYLNKAKIKLYFV